MGRIIHVIMRCASSKKRYKAFFEEKEPRQWCGIRTEIIPEPSFFEKISMKFKEKKSISNAFFAKRNADSEMNNSSGKTNIEGGFFIGDHIVEI